MCEKKWLHFSRIRGSTMAGMVHSQAVLSEKYEICSGTIQLFSCCCTLILYHVLVMINDCMCNAWINIDITITHVSVDSTAECPE